MTVKVSGTGTAGNILKAIALTLATFGLIVTVFSFVFARKMEKLDKFIEYAKDSPKMATISAELAFHSLPDFSESHQIPERLYKVLEQICDKVFFPESPLLRHLEEAGNGATLHYANGLYSFSKGDYSTAVHEFNKILNIKSAAKDIKNSALYRLGITYRQEKRYMESISFFMKQFRNSIGDKEACLQAKYGIALTLYAIEKDPRNKKIWKNKKGKIAKLIEGIKIRTIDVSDDSITAEKLAFETLCEVVYIQRNNYSAILYLAKLYISNPDWFKVESIIDKPELKRLVMEVLRFLKTVPDSLNIKANYLVVETICYLCLSKIESGTVDYKDRAQAALTSALFITKEYKNINKSTTIFSDEQVRQISVYAFEEEIINIASNNNIDLPVDKIKQ